MGAIATTANSVYRNYETDGVPASGVHRPVKSEIRALFGQIDSAVAPTTINFVSAGAVGDGSTDDTVAIQAMLTANSANVVLDGLGKTYKITAPLTIPAGAQYVKIQNARFSVTGDIQFLSVASGVATFLEFDSLYIEALGQTTLTRMVIDFSRMSNTTFRKVWINGTATKSYGWFGAGTAGASPYYNTWDMCYAGNCFVCLIFSDAASPALGPNSNTVFRCRFQPGTGNFGVYLGAYSQNVDVIGCDFEAVGGTGVYMDGTGHSILGCRFEAMTSGISVLTNATANCIGHNYYDSNTANLKWSGSSRAVNLILFDPDNANSISVPGGIVSRHPTAGIGHAVGAGGAVTQGTSRTTGVTLNKVSGAITLFSAAGSASWAQFQVTNSAVAATDTVSVSFKSGSNAYGALVTSVFAGGFTIAFAALIGTATDAPILNFNVIKGSAT